MNEINLDLIDTTGEPPVTEPERQYYYMAKCREIISEKIKAAVLPDENLRMSDEREGF